VYLAFGLRRRLRDRDALETREGLIFRVYGYSHPPVGYVCDVEYAPETIYKSAEQRAFRAKRGRVYYKFYSDEGLRFVRERYPQYTVWYEPLQTRLVGVSHNQILKTRKPQEIFQRLLGRRSRDSLLKALRKLSNLVCEVSGLSETDFGVFGSLLHGFYHPRFSDLDMVIYGRDKLGKLSEALETLYRWESSTLRNEFEDEEVVRGKRWRFLNYSPREFVWHQRRKMVYALFRDEESNRVVKTEFEPVKGWSEIRNDYSPDWRIVKKGRVKALARVTDDSGAPFIPSIYSVDVFEILNGVRVENVRQVVSYVEEFRLQAKRDEVVYVEGNLEQVVASNETFHQITLTYGPRYYEQVLKVVEDSG